MITWNEKDILDIIETKMNLTDLERQDGAGNTALLYAIKNSDSHLAKMVVSCNVDVDKGSRGGMTPLMYASRFGRDELVDILIAAGSNVNRTNQGGWTALMYASFNGRISIMRKLVEAGAHLETTCIYGKSPLAYAIIHGEKATFELIRMGADINSIDLDLDDHLFYVKRIPKLVHFIADKVSLLNERNQKAWKRFRLKALFI